MKLIVPPPVQAAIAGVMMWLVARQFPELSFSFPFQRLIAGSLIAVGLVIELIAIRAFFRARTAITPFQPSKTKTLVVDGLYRFSRNPMYLGLVLLLAGWLVWLANPANVFVLGAFVAYITIFQIKPEEAVLRAKFGPEYDAYCRRVRRWV